MLETARSEQLSIDGGIIRVRSDARNPLARYVTAPDARGSAPPGVGDCSLPNLTGEVFGAITALQRCLRDGQ
jgi:hypothetical protein